MEPKRPILEQEESMLFLQLVGKISEVKKYRIIKQGSIGLKRSQGTLIQQTTF